MKKCCLLIVLLCAGSGRALCQWYETQQLLLNVEKLAQFKQILEDMKKGYDILSKGYGVIKDLSEGNFSLHKAFLDALFEVSPAVRRYKKIQGIVSLQVKLLDQYKSALKRFKSSEQFTMEEISYISGVYERLIAASVRNIDDLAMIITAGKLRMSDDERIKAIDGLYADMQDKYVFLNSFNEKTTLLAIQRAKERNDVHVMGKLLNAK